MKIVYVISAMTVFAIQSSALASNSSYPGQNTCEKAAIRLLDTKFNQHAEYPGVATSQQIRSSANGREIVITLTWDKKADGCTLQGIFTAVPQADGGCNVTMKVREMDPVNNTSYGVLGVDCG